MATKLLPGNIKLLCGILSQKEGGRETKQISKLCEIIWHCLCKPSIKPFLLSPPPPPIPSNLQPRIGETAVLTRFSPLLG